MNEEQKENDDNLPRALQRDEHGELNPMALKAWMNHSMLSERVFEALLNVE